MAAPAPAPVPDLAQIVTNALQKLKDVGEEFYAADAGRVGQLAGIGAQFPQFDAEVVHAYLNAQDIPHTHVRGGAEHRDTFHFYMTKRALVEPTVFIHQ